MSREKFGVETAKELILKYVSEHGSGRWSDFERLGISKVTLHRALKELISEGVLVKEKRGVYVLKVSPYRTAIQIDYGPRLCELIECEDVNILIQDLIENIRDNITYINNAHKQFIDFITKYLKKFKAKISDPLIKPLIDIHFGLLQDKGFYTLVMIELSKFVRGIIDLENCEEVFQGLPEDIKQKFKDIIKTTKDLLNMVYGLNDVVVDSLEKLKEVLKRYGYTGVIKYKLTTHAIEINMEETAEDAIMMLKDYYGVGGDLMRFIYKLSLKTQKYGCGPLSTKEREELLKILQR
jgi:DNA-binding Lrp family transcriptional regulator